MLVQDGEGSLRLADSDELLGPLEHILRAAMRRRRHDGGVARRWTVEPRLYCDG